MIRILSRLFLAGIVLFAALQCVRPSIPTQPARAEVQLPAAVHSILSNSCYSCHSDERRLSWFDHIVPGYWLVRHDILEARTHLNFSILGAQPAAAQRAALFEAANMVQLGAMPLPQFTALHPEARVSLHDLDVLKAWLAPWTQPLPAPSPNAAPLTAAALAAVAPESNNLAFDPSFVTWKLISVTDRGDNNTFRFILGNDVALRAIQSGSISRWPDGARLAKVAWQQQSGDGGLVVPGHFIQVELMVKDAARYKSTEGWGWGRWRGADLKPYGDSPAFVAECTGCHRPLGGNDFVYTLPITTAPGREDVLNNTAAAALPANLPFQPLVWDAITLSVDRDRRTISVLFGNAVASQSVREAANRNEAPVMVASLASPQLGLPGAPEWKNPLVVGPDGEIHAKRSSDAPAQSAVPLPGARARSASAVTPSTYPPGSVLALVTWSQRDDPHWFGARIPAAPLSVEFVQLPGDSASPQYSRYAGPSLTQQSVPAAEAATRTASLTNLTPAWLP